MARLATAVLVSIPIAAILWFEIEYLWFGATGDELAGAASAGVVALALAAAVAWALFDAERAAQVVHRACRLGIAVAIALPIVTVAVLLLWENASGRRDLGMGGLMLYSLPVVAFVAAIVLVVVFGLGRRLAAKRITRGL
jgi:EamA domain-containing membrane protein RarD